MRAEGLDKLLIEVYEVRLQAVKPPHCNRPQARRKDFAHQSFIFGVDGHSLVKLAHMLHKVHLTIVKGEHKLMEMPR